MTAHGRTDWCKRALEVVERLEETSRQRDRAAGPPEEEARLLKKSGLLPLMVPTTCGGFGARWPDAMAVVQVLATGDAATAQIYGYHLMLSTIAESLGTDAQAKLFYEETAKHNLLWANALNTRDAGLRLLANETGYQEEQSRFAPEAQSRTELFAPRR